MDPRHAELFPRVETKTTFMLRGKLTKNEYFRLAKMKVNPNSNVARRRDTVNRSRVIVTEPESPMLMW